MQKTTSSNTTLIDMSPLAWRRAFIREFKGCSTKVRFNNVTTDIQIFFSHSAIQCFKRFIHERFFIKGTPFDTKAKLEGMLSLYEEAAKHPTSSGSDCEETFWSVITTFIDKLSKTPKNRLVVHDCLKQILATRRGQNIVFRSKIEFYLLDKFQDEDVARTQMDQIDEVIQKAEPNTCHHESYTLFHHSYSFAELIMEREKRMQILGRSENERYDFLLGYGSYAHIAGEIMRRVRQKGDWEEAINWAQALDRSGTLSTELRQEAHQTLLEAYLALNRLDDYKALYKTLALEASDIREFLPRLKTLCDQTEWNDFKKTVVQKTAYHYLNPDTALAVYCFDEAWDDVLTFYSLQGFLYLSEEAISTLLNLFKSLWAHNATRTRSVLNHVFFQQAHFAREAKRYRFFAQALAELDQKPQCLGLGQLIASQIVDQQKTRPLFTKALREAGLIKCPKTKLDTEKATEDKTCLFGEQGLLF